MVNVFAFFRIMLDSSYVMLLLFFCHFKQSTSVRVCARVCRIRFLALEVLSLWLVAAILFLYMHAHTLPLCVYITNSFILA
jgi:hypothetical protein